MKQDKRLHMRVSAGVLRVLRILAKGRGETISQCVRALIIDAALVASEKGEYHGKVQK